MVLPEVTQAITLPAHVEGAPGRKKDEHDSSIHPALLVSAAAEWPHGGRVAAARLAHCVRPSRTAIGQREGGSSTIRVMRMWPRSRTKISLTTCVCLADSLPTYLPDDD